MSALKNNTASNYTLLLIAVLILGSGCFEGAPRRHPLDPQGENYQDAAGVTVQVTSFYSPLLPLSGATVRLTPGSFWGVTDERGQTFIEDLPSGSYTILVEKIGYASQSQSIQVTAGDDADLNVSLPGLPAFTHIDINSNHISRWWPPPEELFRLNVDVALDDPDGVADIEEVWLFIPDFEFNIKLGAPTEPGRYVVSFAENELPAPLSALVGHELVFYAMDRSDITNTSSPMTISRVIDTPPEAIAPIGLELLETDAPELSWESTPISFPHTYEVNVVRVDNNLQNVVLSFSNISSDNLSIQTSALPTGEYFWTVSVVDEFGNRSRSREAGFRIR